jgi:hypothetical protein
VGVSLLAMAVCHATFTSTDQTPSRAGSLLQVLCTPDSSEESPNEKR